MRVKRVLAAFCALAVAVSPIVCGLTQTGAAETAEMKEEHEKEEGDWRYAVLEDGTAEIMGYDGKETELTIPESIGGKKVTSIGHNAFHGCSGLTRVEIPESVIGIGDDAFSFCSGLTRVEIPESVTYIGYSAFEGCSGLTRVEIPESVTSIGYAAFEETAWLEDKRNENSLVIVNNILIDGQTAEGPVSIPKGVTSIGVGAFGGCSGLTRVEIPESVTSIETWAFYGCSGLTRVEIPESVTSIGDYAFYFCSGLTRVEIPESVTSIGYAAFEGCSGLTSVEISNGVTSIENRAFKGCSGLTSVEIPESVTYIGYSAFEGCSGLTRVEISNGVTSIEDRAFKGCSGLTRVEIPESVTNIGYSAFGYIGFGYLVGYGEKIQDFTICGCKGSAAEAYAKENGFIFIEVKEKPTEAPSKPAEITIENTGELAPKLEMTKDGILSALSKLFTEEQLEAIKTGDAVLDIILDVTNIDSSVSDEDKELIDKAINNIPDSDKLNFKVMNYLDIKLGALIDGKELNVTETYGEVSISVEIENPANGAYRVIRVHDGQTGIIDPSFSRDGSRLTFKTDRFSTYAIVYADGGKENTRVYGEWEYELLEDGTAEITAYKGKEFELEIPESIDGVSVTVISDHTFSGCGDLTSVTIPDSVTGIGDGAFEKCGSLTSVTIPDSVTDIGVFAFSFCGSLTSVTIPKGVTVISNGVFYDCSSLTGVTIPEGVTSIGNYAFEKCSSLTGVKIPDSVTSIGDCAFGHCSGLESVTIPGSVTSIGGSAFHGCSGLTIYGFPDTAAEAYAKENDFTFIEIKEGLGEASAEQPSDDIVYSDVAGGRDIPSTFIAVFLLAGLAVIAAGAAVVIKTFKASDKSRC
ncbi:MAG: leucine-rich repeat domain-containing protein [Butyrivibrio sp.]|nr:leucine-rich repeat domain-containing protein [Butyrivibrio sp.]